MDQAATLTAIGAGTAFAMLLLLAALVAVVGWVVRKVESRSSGEAYRTPPQGPSEAARAKALAAVAGVTAVMRDEARAGS